MDLRLEQVGPENLDEVVTFLRATFQAPLDAPSFQTDLMRWKFFEPRTDWDGSRSYVFRDAGRILAHGCVVPTTFVCPGGDTIKSIFVTDWAASRSFPGCGILLLKEIAALADIRLGYGGSADTKALVRKGHARPGHPYERVIGEMMRAGRSIRPWLSLRDRTIPASRALARAGRSVWRNTLRPLGSSGAWTARHIERFDSEVPDSRLGASSTGLILPLRTPGLLNYMLDCPSARITGFLLEKGGVVRGHLLLGGRHEEVRVADLVINSEIVEDWLACYSLAASTAKRYYLHAGHLRATAAPGLLQLALLRAGFMEESRVPVLAQDSRLVLPSGNVPVLNMIDSDAAYLF